MIDKSIRVGFIGAGNHASWTLYPCFQYFPQIDLISVCDLDLDKAQSIGSRFGAKHFYSDYHRMLDSEPLEALFCCGGPALHAAVIAEAIKRKMPLFVEKPPAATSAELEQLMQQAENNDATIMVGFMHRFASISVWARKAMASAQFGKTMTIYAREGCWAMPIKGLVGDSGIHHIDLMRFLADEEVEWVQSTKCTDDDKRHAIITIMQFKNGILGQLSLNTLESFSEPSDLIEIHGNNGQWLRLDNWARGVWFRSPGQQRPPWAAPDNPAESSLFYEHTWSTAGTNKSIVIQGYVGEIGHFVKCLENGSKPTPNLCDGYRALQLVEAINESAESGQRVIIE
jgi:myo-inositol 2-dehydrogenase/D-chiro-inositol 1-dehydrogenase